jgi:hypothetical protein
LADGIPLFSQRSIEQLTEELLALPSVSRALLAEKLVESLEFDTDSTLQAVWVTEAKITTKSDSQRLCTAHSRRRSIKPGEAVARSMKYVFHPEALTEYAEAVQYHAT